jgi:hypothetical protein
MTISIADLDKAAVLAALYNHAQQQGRGYADPRGYQQMSAPEAAQVLAARPDGDIDYLYGRGLKVDLSGDTLDPWGYDRNNGAGAAERAIQPLRARITA